MFSALFASKKAPVKSLDIPPRICLLPCEQDANKKTFSLTCAKASSLWIIEDQLSGYFRPIGDKIITNHTLDIRGGKSLQVQFPEYFYTVDVVKTESNILVNITGTDLALQSAIESLIYGKLCDSNDFRAFPAEFFEYAKAVENYTIETPRMF